MLSNTFAIRVACPSSVCTCQREQLLADPQADQRILRLTRQEERKLLERLESVSSLADLEHLQQRMFAQLGLRLTIAPGINEVRSMRGFWITLAEQRGLCRKTRQTIPAAIRRALEKHPPIAYALLNQHDLLRDT